MEPHTYFRTQVSILYRLFVVLLCLIALVVTATFLYLQFELRKDQNLYSDLPIVEENNKVENGIHVETGLVAGEGMMEVIYQCTSCHSAKLITQNRMHKEGWISTIRWMQATQNLGDLGENETLIVNYLAHHYSPKEQGRRAALTHIDWYVLEDENQVK